jgi:hypothetical protein
VAGKFSMIIYGGLDHTGVALGDLWMLDGDDQTPGCSFSLVLSNITVQTWTLQHVQVLNTQISQGWGMDNSKCDEKCAIRILKITDAAGYGRKSIRIKFSATPEVFANCVSPVMSTPGAFEKAVNGTAMAGLVLDIKVQTFEWILIEIQMPFYQFLSNEYCRAGKCLRALCQSRTGPAELVETDQSGIEENSGKIKYCYNDRDGDNTNDYQYSGQCGTNYFCAAPGKRHGHSTASVLIQGDNNMLLLIGGESGDWTADTQTLTMDVHVSYFSALYGTWAKVLSVDRYLPCLC